MHLPLAFNCPENPRENPRESSADPALHHREPERAVLASVVDALGAGRPAVATVTGRPGFGQNALLRQATSRAEALGVRVLRARASSVEAGLRHGVAAQLLSPLDGLAQAAVRALAAPQRGGRHPGLAELLGAARERPTLLALEDAQWLDPHSLRWLQALLRRSRGVPLALLAAGSGLSAGGPDWLSLTSPAPAIAHELVLAPLGRCEVARTVELACGERGEAAFSAAAWKATGGSPAVLRDALATFVREGHRPVAGQVAQLRAIAARVAGERVLWALRGLCPLTVATVRALAVGGPLLDLPMACTLAGSTSLGELRLRAELVATGIAVATASGLRVDPVARARVLAEMSLQERAELHARAAELAHRAAADDRAVADLLLCTRPLGAPWAVLALHRSSLAAIRRGDHRLAVGYLARALHEPLAPALRAQLTFELAAVELVTAPEAGRRLLDALVRDPGGHAELRVRAIDLGLTLGDADRMCRAVADVLPQARGAERDNLIALFWSADHSRRDDCELISPEVPALPDTPTCPAQAGVRAWELAVRGSALSTVRELARRALSRQAARRTPVRARLAACRALCLSDDYEEAEAGLGALLTELRGDHLDVGVAQVLAVRAELHLRAGRIGAAEQDLAAAARTLPVPGGADPTLLHLRAVRIVLELESGRPDSARALAAVQTPPGSEERMHWAHLLFARAMVAASDGDPARAGELLRECGRRLLSRHHVNPAVLPWRSMAALAAQAVGEQEEAVRLSREELAFARQWGAPSALGWAELTVGRMAGRQRLLGAREAVRTLQGAPFGMVYARALAELAAAELAAGEGDRCAAAASLARLSTLTTTQPAGPMAERARLLAEELELPSAAAPAVSALWAALPHTERHTAALAGNGHSNQHIADMLSVSRRTVELRLSRTYKKLRIGGRQELSALVRAMEGR
ncbi:LuxR family transcriptional regulator [Kitasatospora sp. MAA4]|uniref:LuxR family transcriptional regulator n=1 Tax=Kitasatospora sp. MAA4 TaxID=3035093 RepID=UPI00247402D5|nr:LuxR family transcriptional regulator [Kitasatospora sp. MAA4]